MSLYTHGSFSFSQVFISWFLLGSTSVYADLVSDFLSAFRSAFAVFMFFLAAFSAFSALEVSVLVVVVFFICSADANFAGFALTDWNT